jgi:hypothetical protein
MSHSKLDAYITECCDCDEMLPNDSQIPGESIRTATLELSITDGPFVETKEHLGGILDLETDD